MRRGVEPGQEWVCLAGPYFPNEDLMLDRVIADLDRGGIAHRIIDDPRGRPPGRYVFRSTEGYLRDDTTSRALREIKNLEDWTEV